MNKSEQISKIRDTSLQTIWDSKTLDPEDGITLLVTDGSHYSPPQTKIGHYLYATVSNLSPKGIDYDSCNRIIKSEYEKMVRWGCKPSKGDVLFSKDGTVGITTVYEDDIDIVLLSSIAIIRPNPTKLDSDYLQHFLSSEMFRKQIRIFVGGTAIRRVVVRDIKSFEVPLPPIPEQHRIAEILDTVDRTITQTEWLIEKLRAIKSGLLHDLLMKGIGEDGRVRNPEKHPEEFKNSEVGLIPKDCEILQVSDICHQPQYGYTTSAKSESIGPKFLRITDIQGGEVSWDSVPYCDCPSNTAINYKLMRGDILFARTGATTGKSYMITDCPDAIFASYLIRIRTSAENVPSYIFQFFNSQMYWKQVNMQLSGSAQGGVNAMLLSKIKIPAPHPEEQARIADILNIHDSRIVAENQYLQKLEMIKKGLMHDLLTGRVRVKVPKEKNRES